MKCGAALSGCCIASITPDTVRAMRRSLCAALAVAALAIVPGTAAAAATDGQWVAVSGTQSLVTLNEPSTFNTQERTIHTAPEGVKLDAPQWSPDGNRIVFAEGPRVLVWDLATLTVREVAPVGAAPTWMPGGQRIAFVRDGKILTRALDGSDE